MQRLKHQEKRPVQQFILGGVTLIAAGTLYLTTVNQTLEANRRATEAVEAEKAKSKKTKETIEPIAKESTEDISEKNTNGSIAQSSEKIAEPEVAVPAVLVEEVIPSVIYEQSDTSTPPVVEPAEPTVEETSTVEAPATEPSAAESAE
ncbi:hypothetical protein [Streptococcus merionis]|uniref:hypothetical protein n=1 Tax=Streptococcus merionis TaxID=400065 RepID=UPI003517BBFD